MKNAILGLFVILAGNGYATSLGPNIRLQAVTTALHELHHNPAGTTPATVVTVNSKGNVTGSQCIRKTSVLLGAGRYFYTNCINTKTLDKLSKVEQFKLESMIEEAKLGAINLPNIHTPICLAIPNQGFRYTADNENVLLSAGTRPCGRSTYNDSKAAKELVNTLQGYELKYSQMIGE